MDELQMQQYPPNLSKCSLWRH